MLTCLEAGCDGLQIPLSRLSGAPEDGKGSVGSLDPYKVLSIIAIMKEHSLMLMRYSITFGTILRMQQIAPPEFVRKLVSPFLQKYCTYLHRTLRDSPPLHRPEVAASLLP